MTETTAKPNSRGFSRRSFIKGAATLTAAGALVGCTPQGENMDKVEKQVETPEEQVYAGVCRGNCAGVCFLDVHVRDGQVVRTTARDLPNPSYNRICPKGLTHVERLYGAKRLQYPMKRIGERGEGKFERISWDEAIDTVATKWTQYSNEFGSEAMAFYNGSGNYGILSGQGFGSTADRFKNVVGCSSIGMDVDAAPARVAGIATGNTPYTMNNEPTDFVNSKTIICWAANPAISQLPIMHFILEAKDAGARYIVIDPVFNANASKADWFIPINSGTDGVLALGVMREIFDHQWEDIDFIANHTEAAYLIKEDDGTFLRMSDLGQEPKEGKSDPATGKAEIIDPFVVWDSVSGTAVAANEEASVALEGISEVNGIRVKTTLDTLKAAVAEYPLDRVTEITGVPQETIAELARIYAEETPVNTYSMLGCNHYHNAHYNYWSIYSVALITGQVGKPGAGVGIGRMRPTNFANIAGATTPKNKSGEPCQGKGRKIIMNQVNSVLETGMYSGKAMTIKGVYITNGNPATCMAEHSETKRWLTSLDFVVVADICMTETAKYADILLPASHWFEQVELFTSFGTSPYIMWQEKAMEPLFESKPDYQIYRLLADKMGYGEYCDLSEDEFLEEWFDTEQAREMGITLKRTKEEKAVNTLPKEPFISFEGGVFATKSKRARFYQENVSVDYSVGQAVDESKEKTLYWEPSTEADINSAARSMYPYHCISEHMRTRTHSQWWDVGCLKEYEAEPVIKLNPEDASVSFRHL